jgi:hypothetical protein
MIDPTLSRALKLFLPVSVLGMILLYPFAGVLDSRPVSSYTALLILAVIGVLTIVVVMMYIQSKSPLTWRQTGRLVRMRLDAAYRGDHWQEDIQLRDSVLGVESSQERLDSDVRSVITRQRGRNNESNRD